MSRLEELRAQLLRLVHLVRNIEMKLALTVTEPEPALNFWRLIYGNHLDIAVLEWCKAFGSDGEATHWRKIVPPADHDRFRRDLIASLEITQDAWAAYWNEMKSYRDSLVAHHLEMKRVSNYPFLDIAQKSSFFYYRYLIKELRMLGEMKYPNDLAPYCAEFKKQACEIARRALDATSQIKECIN